MSVKKALESVRRICTAAQRGTAFHGRLPRRSFTAVVALGFKKLRFFNTDNRVM